MSVRVFVVEERREGRVSVTKTCVVVKVWWRSLRIRLGMWERNSVSKGTDGSDDDRWSIAWDDLVIKVRR